MMENITPEHHPCILGICDGGGGLVYDKKTGKHLVGSLEQGRANLDNGTCTAMCKCIQVKELRNRFKWAEISGQNYSAGFEGYNSKNNPLALDIMKQWADDPKTWIYMGGNVGTGKTHLAYTAIQHIQSKGVACVLLSVPELLNRLNPYENKNGHEQCFDDVRDIEILALDDLGAQRDTPWVHDVMYRLIDYRCDKDLKTCITSNYQLSDLHSAGLDWQRIAERMQQKAVIIEMIGGSYRKIQGKKLQNTYTTKTRQ